MTFEFEDTGYVKDDEKDKRDAPALLKSMQEGTEEANEERSKRGWRAFHVTGWEKQPFYDPLTHNLTWAIQGRGDDPRGEPTINHSIRLLGRKGTVNVDLVASSKDYRTSISEFNSLIAGLAALIGAIKKFFKSIFGNEDKIQDPQQEQR